MSVPIEDFKIRLKKALAYRNMKPIELANKLNLNKGIISGYLNGKCLPKQKRLMDISNALSVRELKIRNNKLQQSLESPYFRDLNVSKLHFTYLKFTKMVGRK